MDQGIEEPAQNHQMERRWFNLLFEKRNYN